MHFHAVEQMQNVVDCSRLNHYCKTMLYCPQMMLLESDSECWFEMGMWCLTDRLDQSWLQTKNQSGERLLLGVEYLQPDAQTFLL